MIEFQSFLGDFKMDILRERFVLKHNGIPFNPYDPDGKEKGGDPGCLVLPPFPAFSLAFLASQLATSPEKNTLS